MNTAAADLQRFGFLLGVLWPFTGALVMLCVAATLFGCRKLTARSVLLTVGPYVVACGHVAVGLVFRQQELGPAPFPVFINILVFLGVCVAAGISIWKSEKRRFLAFTHSCLALWVALSFAFTADMLISTGCEDM